MPNPAMLELSELYEDVSKRDLMNSMAQTEDTVRDPARPAVKYRIALPTAGDAASRHQSVYACKRWTKRDASWTGTGLNLSSIMRKYRVC